MEAFFISGFDVRAFPEGFGFGSGFGGFFLSCLFDSGHLLFQVGLLHGFLFDQSSSGELDGFIGIGAVEVFVEVGFGDGFGGDAFFGDFATGGPDDGVEDEGAEFINGPVAVVVAAGEAKAAAFVLDGFVF